MRRLATIVTILALRAASAGAHPLGMASVNRYLGARVHARELEVDYLLDLAEIPAWAEIERLDANRDGFVPPSERNTWLDRFVPEALRELRVTLNGRPLALRTSFRAVDAPPGQNGLSTLRVAVELRAPLPPRVEAPSLTLHLSDTRYRDRQGWRELAATPTAHARVTASTVSREGPRAGATLDYPTRALARAPRDDEATFTFERLDAPDDASERPLLTQARRRAGSGDGARLVSLLRDPARSPFFVLFALALAFALGAGHALAPGHGKALVGAWLLGSRGRPRDALTLGAAITVTHTASVFAIGALALVIERRVGSDKVLRALELMSGAMVLGVALSQLPGRMRALRAPPAAPSEAATGPITLSPRAILAMGVSGGLVPCPGALVVLLAAVSMRRLGFGLALLVAFSLGLAAVLSAVGLVFVLARRWFDRIPGDGRGLRALAALSSLAVLALGAALVAKALLP